MQVLRAERFKKDFKRLPQDIQDKLPIVLERFLSDPRHPSLHVKKMEGVRDIWEIRVTDNYRITFQFMPEGVFLRRIGTHDVLRHP
ncbi:MAG: type II toxin-antitoxin system RelE/ParE family toxin [Candidatus Omnitrophica bacterium]|nr:type II toxin-antitoxin system RelE/ParE family toxin [Candidatus Omnitrophota bacterium]